jgi:hypothetical protein
MLRPYPDNLRREPGDKLLELFVDLSAVADGNHDDEHFLFPYPVNDPIIGGAQGTQAGQLIGQRFSFARIDG